MKIQIDKPCHENWDAMTPKEQGRYCNACEKIVVDLTKYSDQEIIDFFKQKEYNKCGQLNHSQIDRQLIPHVETSGQKIRKGLIAASLLGSVFTFTSAQNHVPQNYVEIQDQSQADETDTQEKNLLEETVLFQIKGKVVDQNGKPIKDARVVINVDETKTNKNGEFQLSVGIYESEPLDVYVHIYASGMNTKKIPLSLNFDETNVDMGNISMMEEKCMVKGKMEVVD
ncbi:MAG: hypothetical protein KDC84_12640 [Crocinitomicaceae bacterium]|nr:hypothetical protein [Crocinitomicaceae bacterium]